MITKGGEAVGENEERFRAIASHANDAIIVLDCEGRITNWNGASERMFGYSSREAIGTEMHSLIMPRRYVDAYEKGFNRFRNAGDGQCLGKTLELSAIRKDGVEFPIELSLSSMKIEDEWNALGVIRDITDRKDAEKALQESEERYRGLFNYISSGVAVYEAVEDGADFVFKDFNRAGEKTDKISKDELIGRRVTEAFPGVKELGLFDVFQRVWKTGKPEHHPISIYDDQRVMDWRENYVYKLPTGEIVAVYDDVTKQKKAEEALQTERDHLAKLHDSLGDAVFTVKLPERVIDNMNRAAEVIFGYSPEECLGKKTEMFYPNEEGYQEFGRKLKRAMELGKEVVHTEQRLKRKNGEVFPSEITTSFFIGNDGEISQVIAIVRDITARKEAEEKIKESHEFLQTIIDGVAESIMVIDKDYNVTLMNETAQANIDDTKNPKCHEISHHNKTPCTGEDHPCPLKEIMGSGEPVTLVHEHIGKDGGTRFIEIVASPLQAPDGTLYGIIETSRDITDRKHAEEELLKYSEDLEQANALKDLFTDIMRHDLLNPAGVVRSFTEILLDMEADPKKRDILDTMKHTSSKLVEMIENAALFSKLESIEKLEGRRMDLNDVLRDTINVFKFQMEEKRTEIDYSPKGEYPLIASPLIEDVFSNLVSNAIKYSPDGSMIEVDVQDLEGEWVVSVKDQGEGIPDEDRKKVFTRFERLGKEGVKGVGLGLAIAKRIVDLHSGEIWIENTDLGGSIFLVSLPKG